MVADIQDAGYQVAIHAQGDLAIEQAQNAIENTLEGGPNVLRHRIEHNPFARPRPVEPVFSRSELYPSLGGNTQRALKSTTLTIVRILD